MIQPTVMAYSAAEAGPPFPVLLDATSMNPDHILLLDAFFHVVVWHGDNVAQWKHDKLDQTPEFAYLGEFFKAPIADAEVLMDSRFPVPIFVNCSGNDSQSRFLKAKLNPSVTHNTKNAAGGTIFTDDVSLNVFMEHLRRLAVQP
jgi:protein transport protein SEC23